MNQYSRVTAHVSEMEQLAAVEFVSLYPETDIITIAGKYGFECSMLDAANVIKEHLGPKSHYVWATDEHNLVIRNKKGGIPVQVRLYRPWYRVDKPAKADITVSIQGMPDTAQEVAAFLDQKYSAQKAEIDWWYVGDRGPDNMSITLEDTTSDIYPEYYPWLEQGPKQFFKDFLDSAASILLLSGPPGTGKTSYLRKMLIEFNLITYIGYDTRLFKTDNMFISYITSEKANMMIMEDAESLVLPRGTGEDSIVSRFLNVSDGLIKRPTKKFIFTTNDCDFTNIDSALIRPGRCFGSVDFRKLRFDEAVAAAQAGGLDIPTDEKEYSLAELFNTKTKKVVLPRVGFIP